LGNGQPFSLRIFVSNLDGLRIVVGSNWIGEVRVLAPVMHQQFD
jgi:hypothetical protein